VLETERFAHAVVIDAEGFVPGDNYLNLEPGYPRRVALKRSTPQTLLKGTVSALNNRRAAPIVLAEVVNAE
jgi:hypothetical protein